MKPILAKLWTLEHWLRRHPLTTTLAFVLGTEIIIVEIKIILAL